MKMDSPKELGGDADDSRPVLIVPYMWIGDFVRGHTVVRVLKQRWPNRPVDMLVTTLCAPLVDYMPGVRAGVVWDLPRSRLALRQQWSLARHLRARGYGTVLIMPRTWKSAIAPALAGIPERVGFVGEARFGLLNRWRWGERALPRMIDRKASLALPANAERPPEWPVPQLSVPAEDVIRWRRAQGPTASLAANRRERHSRFRCSIWAIASAAMKTCPVPADFHTIRNRNRYATLNFVRARVLWEESWK